MIEQVITDTKQFLPLEISHVSWDETVLVIAGENWSFSTLSAWRLIEDVTIKYGCWDKEANKVTVHLVNKSIIEIDYQGSAMNVDPVFELSNQMKLEIFTCETIEPWILRLPGITFVGALNHKSK